MGVDKEVQAEAWNLIFCFIKQSAVASAVELEIPDILEKHGGPLSLSELSAASGCPPNPLYRLMRFLVFHGIFKKTNDPLSPSVKYARTSLSRLFTRDELGDYVTMQSGPPFKLPVALTGEALKTGTPLYLKSITNEDSWSD